METRSVQVGLVDIWYVVLSYSEDFISCDDNIHSFNKGDVKCDCEYLYFDTFSTLYIPALKKTVIEALI